MRCGIEPFFKVQILLREPWRNKEGVAVVRKIAESLGIEPTASGVATVSGRIGRGAFESLFGMGAETAPALPIPELLREYVESITIAPPHIYMTS